jgi:rhodanese-related sulfurtransferase
MLVPSSSASAAADGAPAGDIAHPAETLFLRVPDALQALHQGRRLLLVDTRSPGDFYKVHIPGAINVPLAFVASKAFLKNRPFVLVDAGLGGQQTEALKLRQKGFDARILQGGLNLWQRQGGPLTGDPFAARSLDRITAEQLLQARSQAQILYFDLSAQPDSPMKHVLPEAIHLKPDSTANATARALMRAVGNHPEPAPPVVLFTTGGNGYESIAAQLHNVLLPIFFLEGGLSAYKRKAEDWHLAHIPQPQRLMSIGGCNSCRPLEK